VCEIPCGLIAYAQVPLQLLRGDSLLRIYHDGERKEPFRQGQVRIVKDCAGCGRELLLAVRLLALVNFAIWLLFGWGCVLANLVSSAGHAADAIWPTQLCKMLDAFIVSSESLVNVYQVHGSLV